jgi:hypothetical protein
LSRRSSELTSVVMSTSKLASVTSPSAIVTDPVTSPVRPAAVWAPMPPPSSSSMR